MAGDTGNPAFGHVAAARPRDKDAPLTEHGVIPGTLRYMAPEQIAGADVDARGDLFSFGAVVFEMLTGKRAFEGDSAASVRAAVLDHEPPPVSSLQPLAPPALDDIVRRCLAKNLDERWQTASDVTRALKDVAESIVEAPARPRTAVSQRQAGCADRIGGALVAAITGLAVSVVPGGRQRWSAAVPQAGFDRSRFCRSTTCPASRSRNTSPTG